MNDVSELNPARAPNDPDDPDGATSIERQAMHEFYRTLEGLAHRFGRDPDEVVHYLEYRVEKTRVLRDRRQRRGAFMAEVITGNKNATLQNPDQFIEDHFDGIRWAGERWDASYPIALAKQNF